MNPTEIMLPDNSALIAVQRGEIDAQIATAKTFPRDPREFIMDAIRWATEDPETAASCVYRLEKGGTVIEGPSVRLAEIVAQAYGNLRVASRLVAEQQKFVIVEAVAHDLEKNNAQRAEIVSSIWGKHGRFGQDMVQTTILAAQSKARRNAILAVIPGAWVRKVMKEVEAVNAKVSEAIGERVEKLLSWTEQRMKISRKRVLAALGKQSAEALTGDDLAVLRTMLEEIREGGRPAGELFPEAQAVSTAAKGVQDILGDLDQEQQATVVNPPQEAPLSATGKKETVAGRTRRLAATLVKDGTIKAQNVVLPAMRDFLKANPGATDEQLLGAYFSREPEEGAETETEPAPDLPKPAPWAEAGMERLNEIIGGLEDQVGERDSDGISRAQDACPNSLDPDADEKVLRSYCDALKAELDKIS